MQRDTHTVTLREIPKGHAQRKRGYAWMVESRAGGKRTRKFFKHGEKTQAEDHRNGLRDQFDQVGASDRARINEALLREATAAVKKLEPFGHSIADAVDHFVAHLETQAKRTTVSISTVANNLLDLKEKEGASDKHLRTLKGHFRRFAESFSDRAISSVTTEDIETWLHNLPGVKSTTTRANYRTSLSVLFIFAHERGHISANPLASVYRPKRNSSKGYLTPEQAERLLTHTPAEIIPAVAIMLFAGVRPDYADGEMSRLSWSDIRLSRRIIRLDHRITKTGNSRTIDITDNLAAWLKPHVQQTGKLIEDANRFRTLWEKARKDAGLYAGWPSDGTRNSFVSYHVALHGDEYKTCAQSGHDIATLRKHYKDLVDQEDAEAYFGIMPTNKASQVIKIAS